MVASFQDAAEAFRDAIGTSFDLEDTFGRKFTISFDRQRAYKCLGGLLAETGDLKGAAEAYRNAVSTLHEILEHQTLTANQQIGSRSQLAWDNTQLGNVLYASGDAREATECWKKAATLYEQLINNEPSRASWFRFKWAWLLATCPGPQFRDASAAIQLAEKSVEQDSQIAEFSTLALGIAQYRADRWKLAIDTLNESVNLDRIGRSGGAGGFFISMAYWKLDDKAAARQWYDKSARSMAEKRALWIHKNQTIRQDLPRFRDEAAELLGINNQRSDEQAAQPAEERTKPNPESSP